MVHQPPSPPVPSPEFLYLDSDGYWSVLNHLLMQAELANLSVAVADRAASEFKVRACIYFLRACHSRSGWCCQLTVTVHELNCVTETLKDQVSDCTACSSEAYFLSEHHLVVLRLAEGVGAGGHRRRSHLP